MEFYIYECSVFCDKCLIKKIKENNIKTKLCYSCHFNKNYYNEAKLKDYDFTEEYFVCPYCCSEENTPAEQELSIVDATQQEWDYWPSCDTCHAVYSEARLTSEGIKQQSISNCKVQDCLDTDDQDQPTGKLKPYAWPGGYEIFYLTGKDDLLCAQCATKALLEEDEKDRPHAFTIETEIEEDYFTCDECGN